MWSVAQVRPNQAHIAIANLERQGFATFYPTFSVKRVLRHKIVTVPPPVFGGYLLVAIAEQQRWSPINSTYGVLRLLTRQADGSEYREPAVIQDSFIEQLRGCSRHVDKVGWKLAPGTRMRILSGPFAFREALVTWSNHERVRLLLYLMTDSVVSSSSGQGPGRKVTRSMLPLSLQPKLSTLLVYPMAAVHPPIGPNLEGPGKSTEVARDSMSECFFVARFFLPSAQEYRVCKRRLQMQKKCPADGFNRARLAGRNAKTDDPAMNADK
jgi:transcription antitermination factor NusG